MRRQALVLLSLWSASAAADPHPPITSRDYTLDLYQSTVLGSSRTIGMGGAVMGLAEGALGMDANPAAPAARGATSHGTWDWDVGLDWLNPDLGTDYDDDGIGTTQVNHTLLITGALVGQYDKWGLGVSVGFVRSLVTLDDGSEADPQTLVGHVALARSFLPNDALVLGLGLRTATFSLGKSVNGTRTQDLFELFGASAEAGLLFRPFGDDVRLGASVALPVTSDKPTVATCDPMSCGGYILPSSVAVPWSVSAGIAFRFGPSPWNIKVPEPFRDERVLIVAADVLVTGAVDNGYGVTAFLDKTLQASGQGASISVRGGVDFEWIPGWLRVRAGSYWEPGRFVDVGGRLHGTVGIDVRFLRFCFLGSPVRLRVTATADLAERYGNAGLSIGFWH